MGALATVVVGAVLVAVGIVGPVAAEDYPSWDDVQAARQNEADTQAAIDEIEGLLVGLETEAADLAAPRRSRLRPTTPPTPRSKTPPRRPTRSRVSRRMPRPRPPNPASVPASSSPNSRAPEAEASRWSCS